MAGFLYRFRRTVITSVCKGREYKPDIEDIDNKIALGALLWFVGAVAEADNKFLPQEESKIKEILLSYLKLTEQDLPVVLAAIRQAGIQKIDFNKFARRAGESLSYDAKISIIENLFRIACADKNLDKNELEVITKIANLFKVTGKDFLDVKVRIGKEFGLDTAEL